MGPEFFFEYSSRLQQVLQAFDWKQVEGLAKDLARAAQEGSQVFLCGNGGSAGNAIHLANDLMFGGCDKDHCLGLRVNSLPANQSVITCLGNDIDYASIYSKQIAILGKKGDILILLSGSGNSPNIISALEQAKKMGIKSYAILGYTGGKAKELADVALHFPINDMQISEDCQQIVGHMVMRYLAQMPMQS